MSSRSSLRDELAGGVAGGVVAIPTSIGYGMLALSALGDPFLPAAILAGLYSVVVVSVVVMLLGNRAPTAFAPRSIIAVLFGATVADTVVPATRPDPGNLDRTLALVVLILVTAALFQALFGVLRLGNVIRYIPAPVMAGFQNAVALLLLLAQLNALLGLRGRVPLSQLPLAGGQIQPLTVAVGLATVLVIWYAPRFTRALPAPIAGLLVGTALHYALVLLGFGSRLGPLLGTIQGVVPSLGPIATVPLLAVDPYLRAHWPAFVGAALSLALIASLDTLLCAKTAEGMTGHRTPPSTQLLRVGVGNIAAALVAAIPGGINLASTSAIARSGGRTGLASALSALVVLTGILGLGPLIGRIPRVVIAGVVTVVALQLFDRPTLKRLVRLCRGRDQHWRLLALDLSVVVVVAVVTIALDLVWAVAIGVTVAVGLFLYRMSRSVVRRVYRADVVRSKRMREPALTEFLAVAGQRIVVFELEGALFFGTAEKLARQIDAALDTRTDFVILDLRRVNEVDSTGAAILAQTSRRLRADGKHLLLSHLADNALALGVLRDAGLAVTRDTVFIDADAALEWAEDALIAGQQGLGSRPFELGMDEIPILAGLSETEKALIALRLRRATYRAGDIVIRQGDEDRSLFIVAKGTTTVRVSVAGGHREVRLVSYSRGTVFGEMALLDRQPRSATVTADDDAVCYVLSEASFSALVKEHPLIAVQLLANLARELSVRLRSMTRIIAELER
jgi:MFS superfamily sulfate permease-like transporter